MSRIQNIRREIIFPVDTRYRIALHLRDACALNNLLLADKELYYYVKSDKNLAYMLKETLPRKMPKKIIGVTKKGKTIVQSVLPDGTKHGKTIEYFKNGSRYKKYHYKNGVKHGTWREFYYSGEVYQRREYVDGEESQCATIYNMSGEKYTETRYDHDIYYIKYYTNDQASHKWHEWYRNVKEHY
jgi:antitoxin component YwqK of YwqJK toxin-antitoxin module